MTDNRFFTQSQRQELFLRAKGKCQNCSCEISLDDFHADHITPYSLGGKTELSNGQALCRSCNLKKSASLKIDKATLSFIEPLKLNHSHLAKILTF